MFDKAKQRMAERLNLHPKSQYNGEFDAGLRLFQNTAVGTEKVMGRMRTMAGRYWHPNLKTQGPEYPSELLGLRANGLASDLAFHPYSHRLLQMGKTQRAEAVRQQALARDVDLRVIMGLREWLATKDEGFRAARAVMEGKRLEMDRAIYKARAVASPHDTRKIKAETKVREHLEAMKTVQGFVDGIKTEHLTHQRLVLEFLGLQRRYHLHTADALHRSRSQVAVIDTAFESASPPSHHSHPGAHPDPTQPWPDPTQPPPAFSKPTQFPDPSQQPSGGSGGSGPTA